MLRLEEAGYIKLPPGKRRPNYPLAHRTKPPKIDIEQIPLMEKLKTWLNKQLDGIEGVLICQDVPILWLILVTQPIFLGYRMLTERTRSFICDFSTALCRPKPGVAKNY